MATTTSPEVKKTYPVNLTPTAVSKVKEIMAQQNPIPNGLRVGNVKRSNPLLFDEWKPPQRE